MDFAATMSLPGLSPGSRTGATLGRFRGNRTISGGGVAASKVTSLDHVRGRVVSDEEMVALEPILKVLTLTPTL